MRAKRVIVERQVSILPFPTPYQRIMRASKNGKGVRLTAQEAWQMSQDNAILTRGEKDDFLERGENIEEY